VKELIHDWSIKPNGVLHVGAHLGEEAQIYEKYSWTPVQWIEAQPKLAKQLKERTDPAIHKVINAAVWSEDDIQMSFHIASNSQSSSLLDFGTHKEDYPDINYIEEISVSTRRIDSLISIENIPNFINLDIQGAELRAIKGLGSHLIKVDYIYTEVNRKDVYQNCTKVKELDSFLIDEGFERKITRWYLRQGWGDALYIRKSVAKHRSVVQRLHTFLNQFRFYAGQLASWSKRLLKKI
jgi:FkbM family methyltransferase